MMADYEGAPLKAELICSGERKRWRIKAGSTSDETELYQHVDNKQIASRPSGP